MKVCPECGSTLDADSSGQPVCVACLWDMAAEGKEDAPAPAVLVHVDGYEIEEELARGGMGVVYRARQIAPPREVALKMLLPIESGSEHVRDRFRIEMRALAELDHPCILPLYQAGEQDGLLYFTMKLAGGGSLAERLRGGPPPASRWSAELMASLAEAVHYAHQRGVLHRDLKPGNILFSTSGNAFVADFGLAKLLNEDTLSLTRSVGMMGTPCYMAPEVALNGAKAATTASDVYGLGAILYELLAGRPPFVVEGLGAIVRKIAETDPETPSTLADGVPRDLEIVAMTCLAKAPAARYATAGEVAADIRRWLEGVPVLACRPGLAQRAWAWCRRRPALAATAAALVLSLSIGGVWLGITNKQLSNALHASSDAKGLAEAAQARAEGRVEFMLGSFADTLESMGRLSVLDQAWSDLDRSYSSDLQLIADAAARQRQARLLTRWGRTLLLEGRSEEAEEKLRRALLLASASGGSPDTVAEARCVLARTIGETGRFEEALAGLDSAAAELENTVPECRLHWQSEAASVRAALLLGWRDLSQEPEAAIEAQTAAEQAVSGFRQWLDLAPDEPARRLRLCVALRDLGAVVLRRDADGPAPALPYFREATGLARQLSENARPAEGRYDRELAQCLGWCGAVLRRVQPGTNPEALDLLLEDNRIMAKLVEQDGLNWRWQSDLTNSHWALAEYYSLAGQPAEEAAQRERYYEAIQRLARHAPQVREWALRHISASLELGRLRLRAGRIEDARALFDVAISQGQALLERRGFDTRDHEGWHEVVRAVGGAWEEIGNPAQAEITFRGALGFCEAQSARGTNAPWWRYSATRVHRRLADLFAGTGNLDGALEENVRALKERVALLDERWEPQSVAGAVPNAYLKYGQILLKKQQIAEALDSGAECVAVWIRHAEVAGTRARWVGALIEAAEAAVGGGGPLEEKARDLSARARTELYGAGRPSVESADDQKALEKLQRLAALQVAPDSR